MHLELILNNVGRVIELTDPEKTIFADRLTPISAAKKQMLLRAGDVCKGSYFINAGCLRIYQINEKGDESNQYFAIKDWWCADMFGLVTGLPGEAYIEALEDTQILFLDRTKHDELCELVPKFERFFRIILERSLVAHQTLNYHLKAQTAQQRYENFLQRYPDLEMRISQKHIASYIGVTPEFLSKMKHDMYKPKK